MSTARSANDIASLSPPLSLKLERLCALLRDMQSVVVCFSGGIDSALLLALSHRELGEKAFGITAVSPSLPEQEKREAARIAASLGARHTFIDSRELERPGYVQNGPDRCFHCKTELYELAEQKRRELNANFVVNGTNTDDLGDYRPGLRAADLAKVRSPFVEAEIAKSEVRALAKALGLDVWDKPAAACLSSRIPYGTPVTEERLAQIGSFETALRTLGFRQVRVRWHDQIARIEVELSEFSRLADPELRQKVLELGKSHGFRYVTLDLAGYRQGSHNEVLVGKHLRVV